jgi:hypothetical protein
LLGVFSEDAVAAEVELDQEDGRDRKSASSWHESRWDAEEGYAQMIESGPRRMRRNEVASEHLMTLAGVDVCPRSRLMLPPSEKFSTYP